MTKLDTSLNTRLSLEDRLEFEKRCRNIGKTPSTLIREVVVAFNEDRLRIKPTEAQQKTKELYQ